MTDNLPTPELLRKLLSYDPETGKLFWKERDVSLFSDGARPAEHVCLGWNQKNSGKEALAYVGSRGYRTGAVFGRIYKAHRVVWAIVHGYWPTAIDHINGDSSDNRLVNLREVSHAENMRNKSRPRSNSSGVVGVCWSKQKKKWEAYIRTDNARKRIGFFATLDEAAAARKEAELAFGFHENHGR